MDINAILNIIDEWIEKYQISDEDVATLQEILNGIDEETLYGDAEYAEDEDYAEIPDEE